MQEITLAKFISDYETGLIQDVFVIEKLKKIYGRSTEGTVMDSTGILFKVVWAGL